MPNRKLTVVQMLPALDAGGVERGTLELGKYLVEHGHRSIVISAGGRMLNQLLEQGSEHLLWPVGEKRLKTFLWVKKLRDYLQQERPDILHLRSRLPAWIGYLAWRKLKPETRPKLVTTVHGPYSVNWYSAVMTKGQRVIAVSKMIKEYIINNYHEVDATRIRTVYRGIDSNAYNPDFQVDKKWLAQWQSEYPQLQDKYVLCFPGRITRWKGSMHFLQVVALVKQDGIPVHGLLVGEPHPKKRHFLDELKQKATELNIENDISFTGHRTDLKQIMKTSNLVLSLALEPEAFGRTVVEALSLGVPVIGYNHGGVAEQLGSLLPEGLVKKNDILAVADLVQAWYKHGPKVNKNEQFTLTNMLSSTMDVYNELLAEN